eukprot:jgi/Pico_ML_1/52007/g2788.t1
MSVRNFEFEELFKCAYVATPRGFSCSSTFSIHLGGPLRRVVVLARGAVDGMARIDVVCLPTGTDTVDTGIMDPETDTDTDVGGVGSECL